jgi:phosphohistidine phosphatase
VPSLTLLRHAKSDWGDRGTRDFDRTLNDRGRRAARVIGGYLARERLGFDHVVASPAERVRQTIAGVEEGLGRALAPRWEQRIYVASAAMLFDLAAALPAGAEHVLLVGHNPGLEDLALMLAAPDDPQRTAVAEKYPTATLCELALPGGWAALAGGSCAIARFVRPRDLDPELGPDDEG